jgi:small conductance mechanosensitive channel
LYLDGTEVRGLANRAGTAACVLGAFLIAARLAGAFITGLQSKASDNGDLVDLLGRVAKLALITFRLVTALGTAGIDVSALVAGLGLTGFALGFAFRDVLSNLLAGVLILLYRPFSRGDRISVTLQSKGDLVLIPNSNLFTNPIVVFGNGSPPHDGLMIP